MSGRLLAVNVGGPRTVDSGARKVVTSIWKNPVEGRLGVRGVNIAGDDQADRTVHGGPDKAIYAYAEEDARFWEDVLGYDLGPAPFGENLTTTGIDLNAARAGERWRVGSALLEVRQPRLPCFKLGLRHDDPLLPKKFARASRPGAYLGILEEGELGAGDEIEIVSRPEHDVTMRLMADAMLLDHDLLPRLLAAPEIPAMWRDWIAERRP